VRRRRIGLPCVAAGTGKRFAFTETVHRYSQRVAANALASPRGKQIRVAIAQLARGGNCFDR
jgi:hypothetical protein